MPNASRIFCHGGAVKFLTLKFQSRDELFDDTREYYQIPAPLPDTPRVPLPRGIFVAINRDPLPNMPSGFQASSNRMRGG